MRYFVHDGAAFPGGVGDAVVNGLVVEVFDFFFHAFHVGGAVFGLEKTVDVGTDFCGVGFATGVEVSTEVFHEWYEAFADIEYVLEC